MTTSPRRHDPQRRDRIIDACLAVIAENGVAGTTHRRVAAAADVPLGSMTYHFADKDELLREALTRFADSVATSLGTRMAAATTRDEAIEGIITHIQDDVLASPRDLVLTHELYTLAARDPAYRQLTNAWMRASRSALERHLDAATARMVDALIEGLSIHRALGTEPQDPNLVRQAVRRITGPDR
ncbi:MAG: TetR family transcriptional regulator [Brachybacterium sp.]|nr:TetR family transcriptional regulator [Brachybacterium sp.]